MNVDAIRKRLRRECDRAGSQAAFARRAGVSPELVRMVLDGKRAPAGRVLSALGLVRVVVYRVKGKRE